jgi:hypothetical protein
MQCLPRDWRLAAEFARPQKGENFATIDFIVSDSSHVIGPLKIK